MTPEFAEKTAFVTDGWCSVEPRLPVVRDATLRPWHGLVKRM
jgi:hypothetical protein